MLDTLDAMVQSLRDPQMLHATLSAFPMVISLLGLLLVLMLTLTGGKSHGMRWAVVLLFGIGAGTAWLMGHAARQAGATAKLRAADVEAMTASAVTAMTDYEQMWNLAWLPFAIVAIAALLSVFRASALRVMMLVIVILCSLLAAGWMTTIYHHGTQLVYVHGVGIPATPNNAVRPAPGRVAPDNEDANDEESPAPAPVPAPTDEPQDAEDPAAPETERQPAPAPQPSPAPDDEGDTPGPAPMPIEPSDADDLI